MTAVQRLITTLLPEHTVHRIDAAQHTAVLADGSQVSVWLYRQSAHAHTVVTALQTLTDESVIPLLLGADVHGRILGQPAVLVTRPLGTPLEQWQGRLSHAQLHTLGTQLGEIVGRVHLHQVPAFGRLGAPGAPSTWHDTQAEALQTAIATLVADGIAEDAEATTLADGIAAHLQPDDAPAVLICGDIDPASVWVERTGQTLRISALTAWSSASGARPVAEHVRILDRFGHPDWFSLRVGYGEAYDALTTRPNDQLREAVLMPERTIWQLRQAAHASQRRDHTRAHQQYHAVVRWYAALSTPLDSDTFTDTNEGSTPA